jgi:hypothetical protein
MERLRTQSAEQDNEIMELKESLDRSVTWVNDMLKGILESAPDLEKEDADVLDRLRKYVEEKMDKRYTEQFDLLTPRQREIYWKVKLSREIYDLVENLDPNKKYRLFEVDE